MCYLNLAFNDSLTLGVGTQTGRVSRFDCCILVCRVCNFSKINSYIELIDRT